MTRRLYRTPIPEDALQRPREGNDQSARTQLAKLGLLEGESAVDTIAGQPGEVNLRAQYRGLYADRLALELSELLESDSLQNLTFAPTSGHTELDGYYAVETSNTGRVRPQENRLVEVDATLVREGTRASHRRAVRTNVVQPDPGNSFGNDTTALVGVPSAATRVRWIDDEPASQTETPTVTSTVTAEHGDVDLVDARAPSFSNPVLVYELGYDPQGDVDVGVWDTYGEASITDADDLVQWGRVFDPAHDPRVNDELVIENGLLRLWFDDADNDLRAEEWNSGTSTWDTVTLGTSDWELLETDVRRIYGTRVEARVTFRDSTATSTEYDIVLVLPRGYQKALWLAPDGASLPPTGLEDLLDPIADGQVYDAQPKFGLVARSGL